MTASILDCTPDEYRAIKAANFSTLKHALKSALHMKAAMDAPQREQNAGMILGSLTDTLIFTPEQMPSRFLIVEKIDRRTKEGKALVEQAEAQRLVIIDHETLHQAMDICRAVQASKTAAAMLRAKAYQRALRWTDEDTGVGCKALLDSVAPGVLICDFKTTSSGAGWRDFQRTVANFHYHMQAAFYVDGWAACAGEVLPYTFIVAESTAPHGVAVYRLDDEAIETGRRLYKSCLRLWADCQVSGVWPGYPDELSTLELPKWAQLAPVPAADSYGAEPF